MKAAVITSFDRPPRYEDFADPVARDGEVLVEVKAAGLHPIVKALASGSHYGSTGEAQFVPGVDGVGRLADGNRVYFGISRSPYGSFAEKTVAQKSMCITLPDGIDGATAAGLANPGMSSVAALARAKFEPGESILILGATGAAGLLAIQIARRRGAKSVVAAGRNPKPLPELQALGATDVIPFEQDRDALVSSYRRALNEAKIDIVLDYLWGQPAEALLEAVSQKGLSHAARRIRYVQIGNTAGPTISLAAATLRSSGVELLGSGFGSASMEQILEAVSKLFQEAAKNPFQNAVRTAPLRDVERMWNSDEKARIVFEP